MVREEVLKSPDVSKSHRRLSATLGLSSRSIYVILKELKLKPYIPRLCQVLNEDDFDRRFMKCGMGWFPKTKTFHTESFGKTRPNFIYPEPLIAIIASTGETSLLRKSLVKLQQQKGSTSGVVCGAAVSLVLFSLRRTLISTHTLKF